MTNEIECVSCGGRGTFHLVQMTNPDEFQEIICEVCQSTDDLIPVNRE